MCGGCGPCFTAPGDTNPTEATGYLPALASFVALGIRSNLYLRARQNTGAENFPLPDAVIADLHGEQVAIEHPASVTDCGYLHSGPPTQPISVLASEGKCLPALLLSPPLTSTEVPTNSYFEKQVKVCSSEMMVYLCL